MSFEHVNSDSLAQELGNKENNKKEIVWLAAEEAKKKAAQAQEKTYPLKIVEPEEGVIALKDRDLEEVEELDSSLLQEIPPPLYPPTLSPEQIRDMEIKQQFKESAGYIRGEYEKKHGVSSVNKVVMSEDDERYTKEYTEQVKKIQDNLESWSTISQEVKTFQNQIANKTSELKKLGMFRVFFARKERAKILDELKSLKYKKETSRKSLELLAKSFGVQKIENLEEMDSQTLLDFIRKNKVISGVALLPAVLVFVAGLSKSAPELPDDLPEHSPVQYKMPAQPDGITDVKPGYLEHDGKTYRMRPLPDDRTPFEKEIDKQSNPDEDEAMAIEDRMRELAKKQEVQRSTQPVEFEDDTVDVGVMDTDPISGGLEDKGLDTRANQLSRADSTDLDNRGNLKDRVIRIEGQEINADRSTESANFVGFSKVEKDK
ncbi:MAG: hypothetical protein ABIH87_01345 [bacterium]